MVVIVVKWSLCRRGCVLACSSDDPSLNPAEPTNLCEKIVFGKDEKTEMASVGPFYKKTQIIQKLNYIFDSLGKKLFFTLSSSHTNRKG